MALSRRCPPTHGPDQPNPKPIALHPSSKKAISRVDPALLRFLHPHSIHPLHLGSLFFSPVSCPSLPPSLPPSLLPSSAPRSNFSQCIRSPGLAGLWQRSIGSRSTMPQSFSLQEPSPCSSSPLRSSLQEPQPLVSPSLVAHNSRPQPCDKLVGRNDVRIALPFDRYVCQPTIMFLTGQHPCYL